MVKLDGMHHAGGRRRHTTLLFFSSSSWNKGAQNPVWDIVNASIEFSSLIFFFCSFSGTLDQGGERREKRRRGDKSGRGGLEGETIQAKK